MKWNEVVDGARVLLMSLPRRTSAESNAARVRLCGSARVFQSARADVSAFVTHSSKTCQRLEMVAFFPRDLHGGGRSKHSGLLCGIGGSLSIDKAAYLACSPASIKRALDVSLFARHHGCDNDTLDSPHVAQQSPPKRGVWRSQGSRRDAHGLAATCRQRAQRVEQSHNSNPRSHYSARHHWAPIVE